MKRVYQWLGFAVMAACCVFFVIYCIEHWENLPPKLLHSEAWPRFALASAFYLISFCIVVVAWQLMLTAFNQRPRLPELAIIVLISQFAKYLPGNVGQHVGRAMMATHTGLAGGPVLLTMALEGIGAILAALGVAVIAFSLDDSIRITRVVTLFDSNIRVTSVLLGIVILLASFLLIKFCWEKWPQPWMNDFHPSRRVFATLALCIALYGLIYLMFGIILYWLMSFLAVGGDPLYWLLTGAFALSWVAGYLTPGSPGGLGVRESVLILILEPHIGPGVALSLAVALRVVTTVGDALGFAAGLAVRFWKKRLQHA